MDDILNRLKADLQTMEEAQTKYASLVRRLTHAEFGGLLRAVEAERLRRIQTEMATNPFFQQLMVEKLKEQLKDEAQIEKDSNN